MTMVRLRALAYNEDARAGFAEGVITRQVVVVIVVMMMMLIVIVMTMMTAMKFVVVV